MCYAGSTSDKYVRIPNIASVGRDRNILEP